MATQKTFLVWIGIIVLSGMFLMGQDTWSPQTCTDKDEDGYGNPASASCAYPELDCNDHKADINPGVLEGPDGDPVCSDGDDNDCDGLEDMDDPGCVPCSDGDSDGYGDPASDNCDYPQRDCNDSDPDVNPSMTEGPHGHATCSDGKDNECDGLTDSADGGCSATTGMAEIDEGCFFMGDHFSEGDADELPVHEVCLSAYEMDIYEVSNAQYEQCVVDGACIAPSSTGSNTRTTYYGNPTYDDYPVIFVSQVDANNYCIWAGKRSPTEAEWEYAARGRALPADPYKRYPWGNTVDCDDANYGRYSGSCDGHGGLPNDTHSVGSYSPNGYGLYDMGGNVWEWVNDYYSPTYYSESPILNPPGIPFGPSKVFRGGSWYYLEHFLRLANRDQYNPEYRGSFSGGFRCARWISP